MWAYFAGLIDGEGCFLLTKHKNKIVKTGFSWNPSLRIANLDSRPLELLRREVGGIIKCQIKGKSKIYYYIAYGEVLRKILPNIEPFLIIKKEQAQIIQKVLYLLKHRSRRYRSVFVDAKLEAYSEQLKELKRNDREA